ncbi:MAG: flagellar basal body-associated FliL family protein [Pseudooceanicola sp.]|nr:flagellar basal body-associated FliL family protein [Pseudooceanicola sp.]
MIAAILGLSVVGAGVGFFAATSLGGGDDAPMEEAHAPEPAHAAPAPAAEGGHGEAAAPKPVNEMAVTPFKEIIVNISATTATGRVTTRFMKLNVALVYDETLAGADRIEERRLFIRDSFQDYLRLLTEQDLRGSLGLVVVKQELLHRARTVTESLAPQEILVADLIVQ